jgi:hypothetical protein
MMREQVRSTTILHCVVRSKSTELVRFNEVLGWARAVRGHALVNARAARLLDAVVRDVGVSEFHEPGAFRTQLQDD